MHDFSKSLFKNSEAILAPRNNRLLFFPQSYITVTHAHIPGKKRSCTKPHDNVCKFALHVHVCTRKVERWTVSSPSRVVADTSDSFLIMRYIYVYIYKESTGGKWMGGARVCIYMYDHALRSSTMSREHRECTSQRGPEARHDSSSFSPPLSLVCTTTTTLFHFVLQYIYASVKIWDKEREGK